MANPLGINQYTRGNRKALRSMHKAEKKAVSKMGSFNLSAPTSKSGRAEIAKQIKRIRNQSSGIASSVVMHSAISNAAASTRLRNLAAKVSRKK